MKAIILLTSIICLLTAGTVSAGTVSLDGVTLGTFEHIASSSPLPYGTFGTGSGTDYAAFSTVWKQNSATWGWATLGTTLTKGSFNWANGDTLSIAIRNDDESAWYFSFYVSDGAHTTSTPVAVCLVPDQRANFSLSLADLDLTGSLDVWVRVQSTTPWSTRQEGGLDRNAEYTLATVPVPPAVWLIGGGLLGLVGIRRRFKKK